MKSLQSGRGAPFLAGPDTVGGSDDGWHQVHKCLPPKMKVVGSCKELLTVSSICLFLLQCMIELRNPNKEHYQIESLI